MPQIGISSTDIRRRVREGGSIRFLVPAAVAAFIAEQGLYEVL
jgi:nicotinate-nucleotide adenylyltransferase